MPAGNIKIQQHLSRRELAYRVVDVTSILAGLWLAGACHAARLTERDWLAGVAAIVLFYLLSEFSGMYRSWRGVDMEREIACAVLTWAVTVPFLLALVVMTRHMPWVDRSLIVCWSVFTAVILSLARIVLRMTQCYLRARGFNARGFAVIGVNELGFDLVRRIEAMPELGLKLIGFYDDRSDNRLPTMPVEAGHRLGTIEQLLDEARAGRVNMIYITFPMRAENRIKRVLNQLSDTTASVYIVPDFFVFQMLHSRWTNISGLPAVSVFENPFYGVDGFLKRLVDITLATLILTGVALPMLVIGILVKCTSPGPVFFRQKRYGLDGREIMVWKFRSMTVCESGDQFTQATRNDARTTRIGAILRKTSLDELPQLFNVLEGSMSLVGPRPHASMQNEAYRSLIHGYMLRHKVKPGMTGLAQVSGWRGETDTLEKMARRVECDHRYIREWSLFMDLKILVQTVFVVLSRQNAY
jgi:putative colanic acid biosynthesis UDP-glucose lipid carrier transferase